MMAVIDTGLGEKVMKLLSYIVILLLVIFGTMFAVLNANSVAFNYYLGQTHLALSLLLAISLFIGVLFGVCICSLRLMAQYFAIRRLRHQLKQVQQEVKNLRDIPIKDNN